MKTVFDTILNFGWTLLYFLCWGGMVYGPLTGFIVGTTLVPGIGSFFGFIIGIGLGLIASAVIGIMVGLYHTLFFSRNTDLALYRRHLARMVGIATLLFGLFLVGCDLNSSPHYEKSAEAWFLGLGIGGMILIWIALTGAYTAYFYPVQMVRRLMIRTLPGEESSAETDTQSALVEAERFLHTVYPHWAHWGAALVGLIGTLILMFSENPATRSGLERLMLVGVGIFGAVIVFFLFFAYCAFGSGLLVILVKKLVLEDLFPDLTPHRVRVTLTLIAFVYTLIMTWWSLIFAPICALYIARNIYHTLALPDTGDQKAKRKEKLSAV